MGGNYGSCSVSQQDTRTPEAILIREKGCFSYFKKDNLKIILDTMWISIRVFCLTFSGYQLSTHMQLKQEGNQNIR